MLGWPDRTLLWHSCTACRLWKEAFSTVRRGKGHPSILSLASDRPSVHSELAWFIRGGVLAVQGADVISPGSRQVETDDWTRKRGRWTRSKRQSAECVFENERSKIHAAGHSVLLLSFYVAVNSTPQYLSHSDSCYEPSTPSRACSSSSDRGDS